MINKNVLTNDTKTSVVVMNILVSYFLVIIGVIYHPVMYIAFAYVCAKILLSKDSLAITLLLVPLAHLAVIFKLSPQSSSLFTYIQLIAVVKYFLINRRINRKFLFFWFIFIIYISIGFLLNSIDVGFNNITDLIKVGMWPLLFYFLIESVDNNDCKRVLKIYVICVLISSLIGLTSSFIPNMEAYVTYKDVNIGRDYSGVITAVRFSGLIGDSNYYSIPLIIAILISIFLWRKSEIKPGLFYLFYFCLVALGSMTGSKTFLIMLAIVTLIIIHELYKIKHYKSAFGFSFVIVIAVFLLLSGYISAFDVVFSRLRGVTTINDLTTGRSDIWGMYLNNMIRNPLKLLFGNGIGEGLSYDRFPHNAYIDFVDILGVIGSTILVTILFYSIKLRKENAPRNRFWLGFIPIIVMYSTLSMFYSTDLVFQLFAITCFII